MNALINHPLFGSLWLTKCTIKDGYIEGDAWDDSDVGSPYMPDDYQGQSYPMTFPVSCIRKQEE